jgi:hypothetical protein
MASRRAPLVYTCGFTIIQLIKERKESNLPTYITFIDYIKAFAMVNRDK